MAAFLFKQMLIDWLLLRFLCVRSRAHRKSKLRNSFINSSSVWLAGRCEIWMVCAWCHTIKGHGGGMASGGVNQTRKSMDYFFLIFRNVYKSQDHSPFASYFDCEFWSTFILTANMMKRKEGPFTWWNKFVNCELNEENEWKMSLSLIVIVVHKIFGITLQARLSTIFIEKE